jgi:nucleotide-binding universal stress UspA family protein
MISINNILCPTDLTPESNEALRYAVALAKRYDSLLFVMHCIEKPKSPVEESIEDARDLIVTAVEQWTKRCEFVDIRWESVILIGNPAEEINRVATENKADLIVIRSLQSPLAAALFGSTAESVSHSSPCPVLVTHPNESEWAGKFTRGIELQRILVAFDFSTDSELALEYGLSLAQENQTELHLINVRHPRAESLAVESRVMPSVNDNPGAEIERRLKKVIPDETLLWCQLKYGVLEGEPSREILSYAEKHKIDLICMGVKGSGSGRLNPFGSNVDRVMHRSPCPVLVATPSIGIAATAQSD